MTHTKKIKWSIDLESENFKLDSDYIFCFSHNDGFSEKLISIDLSIAKNFQFELEVSDFDNIPAYSNKPFFARLEGTIPTQLKELIEKVILIRDFKQFEIFNPLHPGATDQGYQLFLINRTGQTRHVYLPIEELNLNTLEANKDQMLIQELHHHINIWTKRMYQLLKENCS
ncbi:hypothetical protein K6119_04205 [Paracrocinitomix mangrovi]|uniref:hypothetical protein n=1 Tax=Paracrocinitomix mangrovi TaxID=2862509 RepID=UPI001C8DBA70|nr:hypothetical protein [Paracrocinitomix mangrovi]UKN02716.1 hypothetical protein K6119_04205 [Paracrocinitomix mangrovi]